MMDANEKGWAAMDIQALWMQNHAMLVRYVRRYTHSAAEAEDIVQTTFVRAMEHVETLRELPEGRARAWLIVTARNAFIDETRRRGREAPLTEDIQPAYEEDFSAIHVSQWLEKLPPNLREIVVLRHIEGHDSTEIGKLLELSPATVRTRLRAAMILLRQYETT